MKTVRDPENKRELHVGCGGRVIEGVCIACGKRQKKSLKKSLHLNEPWVTRTSEPFSVGYKKLLRRRLEDVRNAY